MNRRVLDSIAEFHMIGQGDRIAVGLSGGADSVALLHFLWTRREELGIELRALHLNHRLRGEESEGDETFVRALCENWEIPLAVRSLPVGDLARERGESVEECARRERYRFFQEQSGECRDKIATAHTRTDQVETVLFHLARGSGLRGLCGIPPVRGNIIRPLLDCTRQEVEAYCARHGLKFVMDSSNRSLDYSRNKIRHLVLPVLREINPALEETVGETVRLLREDEQYLSRQARRAGRELSISGGIPCGSLLKLPASVRRRVLIQLLGTRGLPYSRQRLEKLEEIAGAGGAVQIDPRWRAVARGGALYLEETPILQPPFEYLLSLEGLEPGQELEIPLFLDKRVYLLRTDCENFEESNKDSPKALKNALDYDRMNKIVSIRQRKPGDSYRPAGRGCTKTLRKLFNEEGTGAGQRSRTLLLSDSSGILWVEGFGPDESVAVRRGVTRQVLLITIAEEPAQDG